MLRAAYFTEFKGDPALLFWGDAAGMQHLQAMMATLSPANGEIHLSGFANNAPTIVLKLSPHSTGMQKQNDQLFVWKIDAENLCDFRELISVLEKSGTGHQYLESSASREIVVIVSRDEYPSDLAP